MPESKEKTLEMRVAELEDKLAQLHISEEEMHTYQKVASKLAACACGGQQQPCIASQAAQQPCVAAQQAQQPCIASQPQASIYPYYPIYRPIYYPFYRPIFYADCIGPMSGGGGGTGGGGGFGGFGT